MVDGNEWSVIVRAPINGNIKKNACFFASFGSFGYIIRVPERTRGLFLFGYRVAGYAS